MKTITLGSYIYTDSQYLFSVDFGLKYLVGVTEKTISKNLSAPTKGQWGFLSETFDLSSDDEIENVRVYIKFNYSSMTSPTDYVTYINGLTVGQWSEEFNLNSLGIEPESIDGLSIPLSNTYAIEAKAYGLSDASAYYMTYKKTMCAKNSTMPMVFGASNSTILTPNYDAFDKTITEPSMIIPSFGFLGADGKYKDLTLEFWIRINSNTTEERRIVGPLGSDDGLYVRGPFMTFKVGKHIKTHFIGEWMRPMLIHIKIVGNTAALLINGEQIFSFEINIEEMDFPSKTSFVSTYKGLASLSASISSAPAIITLKDHKMKPGTSVRFEVNEVQETELPEQINPDSIYYVATATADTFTIADSDGAILVSGTGVLGLFDLYIEQEIDQNWIGFYAYPDVPTLEIDCVAIYSYEVSTDLAKRKFVYGQGVELPSSIKQYPSEKTVLVDFRKSGYKNNYNYPSPANWRQGTSENLLVDNAYIAPPEYSLPQVVFINEDGNRESDTKDKWLEGMFDDVRDIQDSECYISLDTQNSYFSNFGRYILFPNFRVLPNRVAAVYGVFSDVTSDEEQTLFKITDNKNPESYIRCYVLDDELFYEFKNQSSSPIMLTESPIDISDKTDIVAGIDIDVISKKFGSAVGTFLGNQNALSIYVAGEDASQNNTKSFTGKIHKFGFSSKRNFGNINEVFFENGTAENTEENFELLKNHTASYTLISKKYFGTYILDIAISGYWEDYVPLEYFSQTVTDSVTGNSYQSLDFIQFNLHYPTLVNDSDNMDSSKSLVKSYVSFSQLSSGSNYALTSSASAQPIRQDYLVDASQSWVNEKFEVVNGTIVLTPKTSSVKKMILVLQIEFNVPGIFSNPVKVRSMQISPRTYQPDTTNPVSTKNPDAKVYPYQSDGVVTSYDAKVPYVICKGHTPHLYLSKDSGLSLVGDLSKPKNGLRVFFNSENNTDFYKVASMQMSIKLDRAHFSNYLSKNIIPLLDMNYINDQGFRNTIRFYATSVHPDNKRFKVVAYNRSTGRIESSISYFVNGNMVKDPVLTIDEWATVAMLFSTPLSLAGYKTGGLSIIGPALVNNISHYQSTKNDEFQNTSYRHWNDIDYSPSLNPDYSTVSHLDWNYWKRGNAEDFPDSSYPPGLDWQTVLVVSSRQINTLSPESIFDIFTGTNKFVVDSNSSTFRINSPSYKVFDDSRWNVQQIRPL
jgi:hypothetical protein